ncbi:MAG: hypothetical protein SVV67_07760 [Bacillota bacterium]|nr:hypothetical protein [Bacillota bacterium]
MKGSKLMWGNIVLIMMLVLFSVMVGALAAGCQAERLAEKLMKEEEEIDDMEQAGNEKMIAPPIDQNVPAKLATATLAMG